ncbi:MAG TPA: DUF4340 domain-containing protein [Acetobacteraceae bacterium]|jgi:hypothetical protein|nr:DUF4340 domain-containing protein [Acetobacteraceae bacterium]
MTPRTLVILVVLGVVAIAGGWYFGIETLPTEQRSADAGKLMFPDLAAQLQKATKIEVEHQGTQLVIEKHEVAGHVRWGLADRGGYPVQETKLRSMLTALTELRLVEQRTADPTQFATLGVEDPAAKDSNSNLLQVLDASGQKLVSLIVGHRRVRTGGNVPEEVYVRRPNDNQSWLAEGSLEVDSDPQLWLDRDIMNIDHSRIAKVVVTHGNDTLEFARANDKLALNAPADHPKLDDYKLEDVSRALELLTFEDVHADAAPPGDPVGKSVFSTSDGLTVTASLYRAPPDAVAKADAAATPDADRKVLARFSVTGDDKAKAEADRLQARLAGWTYQLGAWKQKSLVPSLDDLKAPAPAAASAGAAPAAPSIATPAAPSFASPGTPPGTPSIVNPNAPAAPPPTAPTAPSSTAPAAGSTPPQATAGTGTKP